MAARPAQTQPALAVDHERTKCGPGKVQRVMHGIDLTELRKMRAFIIDEVDCQIRQLSSFPAANHHRRDMSFIPKSETVSQPDPPTNSDQ